MPHFTACRSIAPGASGPHGPIARPAAAKGRSAQPSGARFWWRDERVAAPCFEKRQKPHSRCTVVRPLEDEKWMKTLVVELKSNDIVLDAVR